MEQHEVVQEVMREQGGSATLGFLYRAVIQHPGWQSGSKTQFASIRRLVYNKNRFFKMEPGLWGLKEQQAALAEQVATPKKAEEFSHSYYQGLLVDLGNLKKFATSIDYHDKNRLFQSQKLSEVATLPQCYAFTYDHLMKKARTVDVGWYNARKLPCAFFEVEHTTGINDALLKFLEFQDFRIDFRIVAHEARRKEFESKLALSAYAPIQNAVKFIDYEALSQWHAKVSEVVAQEKLLHL